jgi:hypothetical protein
MNRWEPMVMRWRWDVFYLRHFKSFDLELNRSNQS